MESFLDFPSLTYTKEDGPSTGDSMGKETIRVVIADDERLARKKLRILLCAEPGIQVIAECREGAQTATVIRNLGPDLLFLDIRMPDLDGFQVLGAIPPEKMPVVIFTTAYDEYAIRAFEARALDYLLKPFDRERLHQAVERARNELRKSSDHVLANQLIRALASKRNDALRPTGRFAIKAAGRVVFLDLNEIDWIEAAANYVRVNAGKESYLLREGIGHISERLDPDRFVRIHRSIIVNINKLRELQPCDGGEYIAVLKNGKELSCSRGYRSGVQELIHRNL
jgi:two-component system LytT family response regulator